MKKEPAVIMLSILLLFWVNGLTIHFLNWSNWYDLPLLVTYNSMWVVLVFAVDRFWNVLSTWNPILFVSENSRRY